MRKLRLREESDFSKVTFVVVAKYDPAHKPPGLHLYFYYFTALHFYFLMGDLQASHLFSCLIVKYLLVVKSAVCTN